MIPTGQHGASGSFHALLPVNFHSAVPAALRCNHHHKVPQLYLKKGQHVIPESKHPEEITHFQEPSKVTDQKSQETVMCVVMAPKVASGRLETASTCLYFQFSRLFDFCS